VEIQVRTKMLSRATHGQGVAKGNLEFWLALFKCFSKSKRRRPVGAFGDPRGVDNLNRAAQPASASESYPIFRKSLGHGRPKRLDPALCMSARMIRGKSEVGRTLSEFPVVISSWRGRIAEHAGVDRSGMQL
jgi:hypothetical protein